MDSRVGSGLSLRLLAFGYIAIIAALCGSSPAQATAVVSADLAVGATGSLSQSGASAGYLVTAFRYNGQVDVDVTVCRGLTSCDDHSASGPASWLVLNGGIVQLDATLPGLGDVNATFNPVGGSGDVDECVDVHGEYAMTGKLVIPAIMRGTVGGWTAGAAQCGDWGQSVTFEAIRAVT